VAHFVVPEALDGERADKIVAVLGEMSRSEARRLVDAGDVTLGSDPVSAKDKLAVGDSLEFEPPDRGDVLVAEPVDFVVRYEDDHLLVVDKPSGMVVHPGAGRSSGTLAAGLLHRYPEIKGVGEDPRWGVVHRLDRDTSGLLVVARTAGAHRLLTDMIRKRQVHRGYLALVDGLFDAPRGTIDAPIAPDPNRPKRRVVSPFGKPSRTHYRRLSGWSSFSASLLEVTLETGRTHQIRVHLAAIEHPVIGDRWYGKPTRVDAPRVFLHASRLAFEHPTTHETITVESPLPPDLDGVLGGLGRSD
jgi:23S rRNA pseudouridine1911/1915/1917 synthase